MSECGQASSNHPTRGPSTDANANPLVTHAHVLDGGRDNFLHGVGKYFGAGRKSNGGGDERKSCERRAVVFGAAGQCLMSFYI